MAKSIVWYRTSVGKKVIMAVTGVILFLYILAHLVGNLTIYLGKDGQDVWALDEYAHFLHSLGGLLWAARVVLLAALAAHIWAAVSLFFLNRRARPIRYRQKRDQAVTYAARTMVVTGPIIFLFVLYHLLHLTFGAVGNGFEAGHIADNVINGFQVVWVSLVYMVAVGTLGFHLSHGVWSLFQTLGANHPKLNIFYRYLATGLTAFVVIGNVSIPLVVMTGIVG